MKDCEFTILFHGDFKIVLETRDHHARLDFGTKNIVMSNLMVLVF